MSNLPPGVTESMIPGNRPEDVYMDRVLEFIAVDVSELAPDKERYVMGLIADGWDHHDAVATTVTRIDDYLKGADV